MNFDAWEIVISKIFKITKIHANHPENTLRRPKIHRSGTRSWSGRILLYGAKHSLSAMGPIFPFGCHLLTFLKIHDFRWILWIFPLITPPLPKKAFKIKVVWHVGIHIFWVSLLWVEIFLVHQLSLDFCPTFGFFMKTTQGPSGSTRINSDEF